MSNEDLKKLLGFIDSRIKPASEDVNEGVCGTSSKGADGPFDSAQDRDVCGTSLNVSHNQDDALLETLRSRFGFDDFRPHQRAIIQAIRQHKTLLVVLPTGYGKSLCYQLPAFIDEIPPLKHSPLEGGQGGVPLERNQGAVKPGLTIVVSPLIALMKDQVEQLRTKGNTEAAYINSSLTLSEQRKVIARVNRGEIRLLYLAPERFRSRAFTEELSHQSLRLFVIDEAHCISQWGHDFRPDYLALRETLQKLQPSSIALFTATVTSEVEADILQQLGLQDVEKFVTSPVRPNLRFTVIPVNSGEDKFQVLATLADKFQQGKGIIYVPRKRDAVEVSSFLQHLGIRADFYHAGRPKGERSRVQEAFFDDGPQGLNVIAATNAFGLGIDKKNLRFVIHFAMPGSLEAYYQEAGRAGRDGKPADCVLLSYEEDVGLQRWFIKQSLIFKKELLRVYSMVERSPGYGRFRWIDPRELEWQTGCDSTKIRVILSHLQRLGIIRQHPRISSLLNIRWSDSDRSAKFILPRSADRSAKFILPSKKPTPNPSQEGNAGRSAKQSLQNAGKMPALPGLPDLGSRIDTLKYCQQYNLSPPTLMESLYDARWQGLLQFHGAENCLLVECLYSSKELKLITKEQLGMKDFERQKNRQLDQMILYTVTPECRQRVIREYFSETVGNDYRCGCCDVCDPSLRGDVMPDASVKKSVAQFLEQRETPELSGKYIDAGVALAFHTVVSRSEHIRTAVGERVYRFKYAHDPSQADWLASRAARILEEKEFLNDIDLVVYVPGTLSDRPYEPVCLFAQKLCEQIDKPLICRLRKTRTTRPQKEMQTVEQKRRNVHAAFAVTQPKKLLSRRILLVDDLFDSGATVNECAKVLKRAGVKKVYVLTLTKTTHVAR